MPNTFIPELLDLNQFNKRSRLLQLLKVNNLQCRELLRLALHSSIASKSGIAGMFLHELIAFLFSRTSGCHGAGLPGRQPAGAEGRH
jgi:hypothetical protein